MSKSRNNRIKQSKPMKIGVISDTHLSAYTDEFAKIIDTYLSHVDMIIHAGDIVDIKVVESLAKVKKVEAVCGNMDNPEIRYALPSQLILELGDFKVGVIHGSGRPYGIEERIMTLFDMVDCIVYGHTHTPKNEIYEGILFFNPGSPTDHYAKENTVGILEIDKEIKGKIIRVK